MTYPSPDLLLMVGQWHARAPLSSHQDYHRPARPPKPPREKRTGVIYRYPWAFGWAGFIGAIDVVTRVWIK